MAQRWSLRWLSRGIAATALGATLVSALPAKAAPWFNRTQFANESFQNVWRETDANPGNRSLTWGPTAWWDYREFYRGPENNPTPNNLRQVQYFDKARMEINNPDAPRGRFYVTNGLLPVEMVSGRVKLAEGNSTPDYEQRQPAQIPVAGDVLKVNPDAPTYASFRLVASTSNDNRAQTRLGQRVDATFDKSGNIGVRPDLATAGTEIVAYNANTGHNLPAVFKNFQDFYDQLGGNGYSLFVFGYPITEPYWVRARVGGQDKDVMVQMFERRVLTYTPSNPTQYQVEMGNVGQHYFQWRYPNQGTPWDADPPYFPVAYASNRVTPGHLEVFTTDISGSGQNNITAGGVESVPFSMLRSWEKTQVRILGDSKRDTNKRQLYSYTINGSDQRRIHSSTANDYQPAVSPDGTKIAFVSDRDGNPELFLMSLTSGAIVQLTTKNAGCISEYPSWYPDGSGLVYQQKCPSDAINDFDIFRAALTYTQDNASVDANKLQATLINPVNLTNTQTNNKPDDNNKDDIHPRLSPSGQHIVFSTMRHEATGGNNQPDGNSEIAIASSSSGTAYRRLTTSSGGKDANPTWSPDGAQIVYASDQEGDYELYVRNFDGSGGVRQLTDNTANDLMPIYSQ